MIASGEAASDLRGLKDVAAVNRINGDKKTKGRSAETARPSSGHTGVVNVAMLGGSVMTMSEGIDYQVYQSLMTPQTNKSDVPNPSYVLKEEDYAN